MKIMRSNLGVIAIVTVVAVIIISLVTLFTVFSKSYYWQTFTSMVEGDISFNEAVTRMILERRMTAYGVTEIGRRRLDETLTGIPDKLEGTAENDRRGLADLILRAGSDGNITDEELTEISKFIGGISK
jgi:hypothetical protein